MGDMRASGPCDALEKLKRKSSERASVKHGMIFRAGESETLEHLRGLEKSRQHMSKAS